MICNGEYRLLLDGVNDDKSTSFILKQEDEMMLYILTGREYLSFDGETVRNMLHEAYRPIVTISRSPSGGGTTYEGINLLTGAREDNFLGDAESLDYYLSASDIDSVDKVEVANENGGRTELKVDTDYVVNLVSGKVTFKKAYAPVVTGRDNVFIQYTKNVKGYPERVTNCTICSLYGVGGNNRVFLSGNPDYKAYDWYSELYRADYIPDINYSIVGSVENAIMGYHKLGNYQVIIKENSQTDSTIFQRIGSTDSNGKVIFSLMQGLTGLGAISKHCFSTLIDEPLFLTENGIYAITSNSITAERTIKNRSFYVDNKLLKESNLKNACSCEWNGYYILVINNKAYVLDSKNKSYRVNSSNIYTNDYIYECYYWDNIPAISMLSANGDLYFGTSDGRLCRFNNDIESLHKYNDDDNAVVCCWATKLDDDNATYLYKTLQKRGCMVTLKPYSRSSAKIYVSKDGDIEKLVKEDFIDIFDLENIDFERFTFETNDSAREIIIKTKVKKYKRLQIIVKNDAKSEGFGIFQIIKTYTVGSYVRR